MALHSKGSDVIRALIASICVTLCSVWMQCLLNDFVYVCTSGD